MKLRRCHHNKALNTRPCCGARSSSSWKSFKSAGMSSILSFVRPGLFPDDAFSAADMPPAYKSRPRNTCSVLVALPASLVAGHDNLTWRSTGFVFSCRSLPPPPVGLVFHGVLCLGAPILGRWRVVPCEHDTRGVTQSGRQVHHPPSSLLLIASSIARGCPTSSPAPHPSNPPS